MGVMVLKPPGVYVALKIVAALADRVRYSQLAAKVVKGFDFGSRPGWYTRSAEAEGGQSQ
jgi:hypothetical protein